MYLKRIQIKNIRSIQETDWEIETKDSAGWHVILGDNGSGKSTFIRSVALALVGPSEAIALRQDWNEWLRKGQEKGAVLLSLLPNIDYDVFSGSGPNSDINDLQVVLNFIRQNGSTVRLTSSNKPHVPHNPDLYIWADHGGWFSAAYGPFRRFSGGNTDDDKIFNSNPKLAAHLSAFGEGFALTEVIKWLKDLKFKNLEANPEGEILDQIIAFINQDGFLPNHVHLQNVSSDRVQFVDGNGCDVSLEELSDGYRSILSMTFELIRQMVKSYPSKRIFSDDGAKVIVPGVVLIDEVDAHLHPSWQRQVGLWFREHFPNIQFIVTTHSPFVCQAADVRTVWRLPKPGSKEKAAMVTGTDLDRLLYGNVLDAYSTDIFGSGVTRSPDSKKRLQRLAELNMAEFERKLTASEHTEMEALRSSQPTAAHSLRVSNGSK